MSSATCSEQTSCTACYNTSVGCHWCGGDSPGCHTLLSKYGCLVGVGCYDTSNGCVRDEPELWNVQGPDESTIMGVIVVVATVLLCCVCCTVFLKQYAKSLEVTRRYADPTYLEMAPLVNGVSGMDEAVDDENGARGAGFSLVTAVEEEQEDPDEEEVFFDAVQADEERKARDEEEPALPAPAPPPPPPPPLPPQEEREVEEQQEAESGRRMSLGGGLGYTPLSSLSPPKAGRHGFAALPEDERPGGDMAGVVPIVEDHEQNTAARRVECVGKSCCSVLVAALFVFGVLVLLYAPHYPTYNLCSTDVDWGSIVSGMADLEIRTDYELLMSIYNPNRFTLTSEMASGVFKHDGVQVGAFEVDDKIVAPGGHVTDVLVTVSFRPSVWQSLQLETAYYEGTLTFTVDTTLYATIEDHGTTMYRFTYKVDDYFVHVGEEGDRRYCLCKDW